MLKVIMKRAFAPLLLRALPSTVAAVPTMLSSAELRLLYRLARDHWDGRGLIVDAGCFLGGSTIALGEGIRLNKRWRVDRVTPVIHSYDLFEIEDFTVGLFFSGARKGGESFEAEYRHNITPLGHLVAVHPGNVLNYSWNGNPIEILFVDLAKHWIVNDHVVKTFFPHLVPGHSIVLQQDYLYHQWNGWIMITMEFLSDYFQIEGRPTSTTVAFRLVAPIPPEKIQIDVFQSLGLTEIEDLFERASARFSPSERAILAKSYSQLMAVLREHRWRQ